MKIIGKIIHYNGKYGTIVTEKDEIDFSKKDISLNQEVSVGDLVEFRLENKSSNIKIARNINKLKN